LLFERCGGGAPSASMTARVAPHSYRRELMAKSIIAAKKKRLVSIKF
jgi:hypothetical protein